MNSTFKDDLESLAGRIDETINEIKYPPMHPTLSKDDILELLKEASKQLNEAAYVIDDLEYTIAVGSAPKEK